MRFYPFFFLAMYTCAVNDPDMSVQFAITQYLIQRVFVHFQRVLIFGNCQASRNRQLRRQNGFSARKSADADHKGGRTMFALFQLC